MSHSDPADAQTEQTRREHQLMTMALEEARKSPPKPTNFCVGALLVDESAQPPRIIATGYTLELEGNTHAEQCCFQKVAEAHNVTEDKIGSVLPESTVLYTTMEPCVERLSGNLPCLERILRIQNATGKPLIKKVYTGVKEPSKFVNDNNCEARLQRAGIRQIHVSGLEKAILAVATAGHAKS